MAKKQTSDRQWSGRDERSNSYMNPAHLVERQSWHKNTRVGVLSDRQCTTRQQQVTDLLIVHLKHSIIWTMIHEAGHNSTVYFYSEVCRWQEYKIPLKRVDSALICQTST